MNMKKEKKKKKKCEVAAVVFQSELLCVQKQNEWGDDRFSTSLWSPLGSVARASDLRNNSSYSG
jgi:hypothetical protein